MKTVRRILEISLLLLLIWAIGYLVYSSSRLFSNNSNEGDYIGTAYQANNREYYLEISNNLNANLYVQGIGKELLYESFADGILTYRDGKNSYYFLIFPEGLYDMQLKIVLTRC